MSGASVDNPEVTARAADAPDFVAMRMLENIGESGAGEDFGDGTKRNEIDDRDSAVGAAGDIGVEVEAGAKEGRTMFAEENDDQRYEENEEKEVDAEVFAMRHVVLRFYMRK